MFVEGIASYYNPSIKANDFAILKNPQMSFTLCLIHLDFWSIKKNKNTLKINL